MSLYVSEDDDYLWSFRKLFYFIAITQPWKQLLSWFRIQHLCYISVETTPSVAAWNRLSGSPVGPIGPCVRGLRPFDTSVPRTRAAPLSPKSVHAHTLRPLTQLKHCGGGPEVSQEVSCEGSVGESGDDCCCVSAQCWPPGLQRGTDALWEDFDHIGAKQNNMLACGIISHSVMWERSTTKDLIQHFFFSVPTVETKRFMSSQGVDWLKLELHPVICLSIILRGPACFGFFLFSKRWLKINEATRHISST